MSAEPGQRPALGQQASIGSLYDANSDSFLATSLFNGDLPEAGLTRTTTSRSSIRLSYVDSMFDKFESLSISVELGASLLAGFITPRGSGQYVNDKRGTDQELHAAVYHKLVVAEEKLNPFGTKVTEFLAPDAVFNSGATHVITGIEYGAQTIITTRLQLKIGADKSSLETAFRDQMESLHQALTEKDSKTLSKTNDSMTVAIYSDMIDDEIMMDDMQQAHKFIQVTPLHIKDENGGKGKPIMYTVLPIAMLPFIFPTVKIPQAASLTLAGAECLKKIIQAFERFVETRRKLSDYQVYATKHKAYLGQHHLKSVSNLGRDLEQEEADLRTNFPHTLREVRAGRTDPDELWKLLRDASPAHLSPGNVDTLTSGHRNMVDFIVRAENRGGRYFGHNGAKLSAVSATEKVPDDYMFLFNKKCTEDEKSWKANEEILLKLLNDRTQSKFVAIIDCDVPTTGLELTTKIDRARIVHHRDGQEVTSDLSEHYQFLETHCFARCAQESFDSVKVSKPIKRRFVKIACPKEECKNNGVCDWMCPTCMAPLEFGFTDQYLYCDCGRSLYKNYEFRCNKDTHDVEYTKFNRGLLLSMLKSLETASHFNILILGETGVGKSTFINAFVNYLTFETLDDALKAAKLNWVIPCSFSTQVMDRTSPQGTIEQTEVKVGDRSDESDGAAGNSATQQTIVYPIMVGSSTIRLIDTPGIGDTRGLEYDRKNMADVLSTLSSYEELHGVLVLLKSNNARLTTSFAFCIKELLTHLHHNAAQNVAFGFTNTRISNYTPGDTLKPLQTLLAEHLDIGLGLWMHTTYCFDSESFRYLAAAKSRVQMGNEEDFRRSWKHSRGEAWRLIDHFKTRQPHSVNSTISLNGTRELISELTKPMAEISQIIRTNIAMTEDDIKALEDKRMRGKKLRDYLIIQKKTLKAVALDRPRTVCAHADCTEIRDDGNGENKKVTLYHAHCHGTCYLKNVTADQLAHPGLISCTAFAGTNFCTHCSHHWQEHMHVLYELHEEVISVKDSAIEEQMAESATDLVLKQTAINARKRTIDAYKLELKEVRKAAAEFGLFLKAYSIRPYNDATIAYIKLLIKEEKMKINHGGSETKLEFLQLELQKYRELVQVLENSMKHNPTSKPLNEEGVSKLVQKLYNLPHFGKTLKQVKTTTAEAYRATHREMPYRVKTQSSWALGPIRGLWSHVGRLGPFGFGGKSGSSSGNSGPSRSQLTTSTSDLSPMAIEPLELQMTLEASSSEQVVDEGRTRDLEVKGKSFLSWMPGF